jgi:hypothetical protein
VFKVRLDINFRKWQNSLTAAAQETVACQEVLNCRIVEKYLSASILGALEA